MIRPQDIHTLWMPLRLVTHRVGRQIAFVLRDPEQDFRGDAVCFCGDRDIGGSYNPIERCIWPELVRLPDEREQAEQRGDHQVTVHPPGAQPCRTIAATH